MVVFIDASILGIITAGRGTCPACARSNYGNFIEISDRMAIAHEPVGRLLLSFLVR